MSKTNGPVYYKNYLQLEKLLDAQTPLSNKFGKPAHDEMLFVIVHQAYELWFKQIIHELDSIIGLMNKDRIPEKDMSLIVHRLERIGEIVKLMQQQFKILETMTPLDFLDFRSLLSPASGFQSYQFRLIEVKLGFSRKSNEKSYQDYFGLRLEAEEKKLVEKAEATPGLATLLENWLARFPFLSSGDYKFWSEYHRAAKKMFAADKEIINQNAHLHAALKKQEIDGIAATENTLEKLLNEKSYPELNRKLSWKASLSALFILLYRDEPLLQTPFRLLQSLVKLDDEISSWRNQHAMLALRMLGTKIGTGGTSGHKYLKWTADHFHLFPDLTTLSSFLIPKSEIPILPPEIKKNLDFTYS